MVLPSTMGPQEAIRNRIMETRINLSSKPHRRIPQRVQTQAIMGNRTALRCNNPQIPTNHNVEATVSTLHLKVHRPRRSEISFDDSCRVSGKLDSFLMVKTIWNIPFFELGIFESSNKRWRMGHGCKTRDLARVVLKMVS